MITPEELPNQFKHQKGQFERTIKQLRKKNPRDIDSIIHEEHYEVFSKADCLSCANCCKTTGPLVTDKDIERIAKHFKIKSVDFVSKYLKIDNEGDNIVNSLPCPFLGTDNYCSIYDVRPKACKEFPHTDRPKQQQILDLDLKNIEVCPAVFEMFRNIRKKLGVQ